MKRPINHIKTYLSLGLAVTVVTVFSLRSFAAPESLPAETDPVLVQECTGTLTIKSGSVNVNGNAVQTGATIMTGSIIATTSEGDAVIDFGAIGRLELGNSTTVTLTCIGGIVQVRSNCSKTYIKVRSGKVDVTQPKTESLESGKDEKYDGSVEATAIGGTDWLVDCRGNKAGGFMTAGLLGLLGLIGVGTAVAVGVTVGGPDDRPAPSSPTR
jgi:hypothetical protein